jgi:hypothetical protein
MVAVVVSSPEAMMSPASAIEVLGRALIAVPILEPDFLKIRWPAPFQIFKILSKITLLSTQLMPNLLRK